jgi:ATP-dependent Lhr-like helicase
MNAFQLLHPTVQQKLYDMKWTELRPIQAKAIQQVLGETPLDCIISSPTASGKTEAAFLPVISSLATDWDGGVRAMYVGPLKALINDQFRRLEDLCSRMELPVHKWHGDVSAADRKRLLTKPSGILLITPESLEAMFVLRPTEMPKLFGRLGYVVIDELHSFIGSVRGAQLLSQLHRLRARTQCDPLRLGLSATLGDPTSAKRWLRSDGRPVRLIEAASDGAEIAMRVRGFWRQVPPDDQDETGEQADGSLPELAKSIWMSCHGKTNLVFANSKTLIESLADALVTEAGALSIPDEVVVHHGSLSKESREHAEARLRAEQPCSAICSNTLEMGIDIGEIDSVVQVSAPWSVASLVQRLGRSGRRAGSKRILRGFFVEDVLNEDATYWDTLYLDLVRAIAIIELMLERFIEPTLAERANLSTLVQQIMSSSAETGGIQAAELFERLIGSGAFSTVKKGDFGVLLRELGARHLIEQLPDGTLVLGVRGQRIAEHYSFYAAFKSPEEFQVLHGTRPIGTLPEDQVPPTNEHVILAGRRWRVDGVEPERKQVYVVPASGRRPPKFKSGLPDVHPRVHRKMRALLMDSNVPPYLDDTAAEILAKARAAAKTTDLRNTLELLPNGARLFLWAGSRVQRTLCLVFAKAKVPYDPKDPAGIELNCEPEKWAHALRDFIDKPDATALAAFADEKMHARVLDGEKFDPYVPRALWAAAYGREQLDVQAAVVKAKRILSELQRTQQKASPPSNSVERAFPVASLFDWARAIAAAPTTGQVSRTILVPSENVAHALRRRLAESNPEVLNGTRFVTAVTAATDVLHGAGVGFDRDESVLRPLRVERWLGSEAAPQSLQPFAKTEGWAGELSRTIGDLEAADLSIDDAATRGTVTHLIDLWRQLDLDAGSSWTRARVLLEAARLLELDPALWPYDGPTLALGRADDSAVEARFVRACPRLALGIAVGRPTPKHYIDRIASLFGPAAAEALAKFESSQALNDELSLLQHYLFESPDRLTAPHRSRSSGADGSVSLDAYASVSDEIDAAVSWVAHEIVEHGTRAQDIAILAPDAEPWSSLLADRLGEIPSSPDVFIESGRTAVLTMEGQRIASTLQALGAYLPANELLGLVPRLRPSGPGPHLSRARARRLLSQLPTLGGSRARPADALSWLEQIKRTAQQTDDSQASTDARSLIPAFAGLTGVADLIIRNCSVADIWPAFRSFAESHLIVGRDAAALLAEVETAVLVVQSVASLPAGTRAVELILESLRRLRSKPNRFGSPAIYVGTIRRGSEFSFAAVRIVGLAEGAFPRVRRERIGLPDVNCRQISSLIPVSETAVASDLIAFDAVARATRQRLAFSYSRRDVNGSEREAAAIFVEIASALARPNPATGQVFSAVPTLDVLERDYFASGRSHGRAADLEAPLTSHAWLTRASFGRGDVPSTWLQPVLTAPVSKDVWANFLNGQLGSEPLARSVPGIDTAISASGLKVLLRCPHQFLLERILQFRPVEEPAPRFRIAATTYGTLVHRVAEVFYAAHGAAFGRRESTLATWTELALGIANMELDRLLERYALVSSAARSVERTRLQRDVRILLELDWGDGAVTEFVGVELSFGTDAPLSLSTPAGSLLVHGRLDRVDKRDGISIVRDLKTGRAKPRKGDATAPDPAIDLQLALYTEVLHQSAPAWQLPTSVGAAYVHTDHLAVEKERSFIDDVDTLRTVGRDWLSLGTSLLRERLFPRTTDADTCRGCDFSPVCGPGAAERSAEELATATGTLAAFRDLAK